MKWFYNNIYISQQYIYFMKWFYNNIYISQQYIYFTTIYIFHNNIYIFRNNTYISQQYTWKLDGNWMVIGWVISTQFKIKFLNIILYLRKNAVFKKLK